MKKFLTKDLVFRVAFNCLNWLNTDDRLININYHGHSHSKQLNLNLGNFRSYLDKLFVFLVKSRVGTDTEVNLGHYTLTSRQDKKYVVVKRSKNRLPREPNAYVGWVDWDVKVAEDKVKTTYVSHIQTSYYAGWGYGSSSISKRLALVHVSILSQVLLQCLFGIDSKVDLTSKPLPTSDIKCRLGDFHMLYDHQMQEWRIWLKN